MLFTESYVADEIITSRAGKRVRVGNTDAEGRMAMADPLCEMKEQVTLFLITISYFWGYLNSCFLAICYFHWISVILLEEKSTNTQIINTFNIYMVKLTV